MEILKNTYPIFEANQTLTHEHLNDMFAYLDEQERLTRVSLIGIGIVCGLEIQYTNSEIHLSKGCGITSKGYLIVEPKDIVLTSYRKLPESLDYSLFEQYSLWELFPADELTDKLSITQLTQDFLNDKAVLLFLELKEEELRNCSSSECNDKGFKVTATVRRLLVNKDVIAKANQLETGLALTTRLNLPDLHLPRYNVPNTGPATSNEVLAAFLSVFITNKLVFNTGKALESAYNAFKPILQEAYPSNPFETNNSTNNNFFSTKFGFLDNAPTTPLQVQFLPYYYDFFDDLLKAYNEFRWKGVELLCTCCPPESLFPCHLMLGVLFPDPVTNLDIYRHHFLAAAVNGCEQHTKEVVHLFQRIVEMIVSFSDFPQLPEPSVDSDTDDQIRIIPSQLGDVPLSNKAIPYYYRQNDTLPLYQLWNFEKTRQNRAHHNLSYRSDEYDPPAPDFVVNALNYDLEQYNFLRIEGHLGKSYQHAVNNLLALKDSYRLPIDIIALPAGKELDSFLKKNPGIQHKAGVSIGGTFIVVYHKKSLDKLLSAMSEANTLSATPSAILSEDIPDMVEHSSFIRANIDTAITDAVKNISPFVFNVSKEELRKMLEGIIGLPVQKSEEIISKTLETLAAGTIIADFYLPYRRTGSADCSYPVIVRECEHKWIDSIRHINNLSLRDYRFKKTEKAPAANEQERKRLQNNYIVRIYRYEIQGVSMLSGAEYKDIEISISSLREEKLSAIARKLNETFPLGLVFDYKPASGRILMRYIEGHYFRIELGGIQGNQIRYAYENDKFFRWQKQTWEELGQLSDSKDFCRIVGGPYQEEEYKWVHENYEPRYPKPAPSPTAKEVIRWQKMTLQRAREYSLARLPIYEPVLKPLYKEIKKIDPDAKIILIGSWANGSWISRNESENQFKEGQQEYFLRLREKVTGKTGHNDINLLVESDYEITPAMSGIASGYNIHIFKGKKDAQKGLVIDIDKGALRTSA